MQFPERLNNTHFTEHQTPFRVPEHKLIVYSTWDI